MANPQLIANLTTAIAACNTDTEVGPNVLVDPDDPTSFPTSVATDHKIQFLVDSDNNLIGFVNASGSYPVKCCEDIPVNTEKSIELSCPTDTITDPNELFTLNFIDNNPPVSPNTRRYDLLINGIDTGPSILYPTNSNTTSAVISTYTAGTSGTATVELICVDNGDSETAQSFFCEIAYSYPQPQHENGLTFNEIEIAGKPNNCYLDDDHYVAEFLYQNPTTCYYEIQTIDGTKCVVPVDAPTPPADCVQLPAPSGGDDTAAIESIINASPGGRFCGTGGTYRFNDLDIAQPDTWLWNIPAIPASAGTQQIFNITGDDCRLYDSPQDGLNQGDFNFGIRAEADGFHIVRSGTINIRATNDVNSAAIFIQGASKDFHIACNTWRDIIGESSDAGLNGTTVVRGSSTARANAVWYTGQNATTSDGGLIINNYAENFQSNGAQEDAEFLTMQAFAAHAAAVKVFGNRGVDAGKRFVKVQDTGGVTLLSNEHEWRDDLGPLGRRRRRAKVELNRETPSDVIARNNRWTLNGTRNWTAIFSSLSENGAALNQNNVHFDCNDIENNVPWNGSTADQYYYGMRDVASGAGGTDNSQEPSNSSIDNNRVIGTGEANYYFWMGNGYDLNSGPVQPTGNTFNAGPNDPRQGIERQSG